MMYAPVPRMSGQLKKTEEIVSELQRIMIIQFKAYHVSAEPVVQKRLQLDWNTMLRILQRPGSIHWSYKSASKGIYILCEDVDGLKYYVRAKLRDGSGPRLKVYQSSSYTTLLNYAMSSNAYRLYAL